MLGWLSRMFTAAKPEPTTSARGVRVLRARYDAAANNDENRRHWGNADGLSANSANSPEVRRLLRNRSRYEVANNSYAKGIVLTLAHDVIGTGPHLQMLTENPEANRRIEKAFMQWAKSVNLAEKLRTMRMARAVDGEAFGVLVNNPALPTDIQLDLRLVEADQVTTPDLNSPKPNAIDGIVFDNAGNPVEFNVLRQHPGDASALGSREYDTLPAESVLHSRLPCRSSWASSWHSGHHAGTAALRTTASFHVGGDCRQRKLPLISLAFSTPMLLPMAKRIRPNHSSQLNSKSVHCSPCPVVGK